MKKRILGALLLSAVLFAVMLLSSCEIKDEVTALLYEVENESAPYFKYDPQSNTTEASLNVRIPGATFGSAKSFSFYAEFYGENGELLEQRLLVASDIENESDVFSRFYQLGGDFGAESLPAVSGHAVSVCYRAADTHSFNEDDKYNADGSMKWTPTDIAAALIAIGIAIIGAFECGKYTIEDGKVGGKPNAFDMVSGILLFAGAFILFFCYVIYVRSYVNF